MTTQCRDVKPAGQRKIVIWMRWGTSAKSGQEVSQSIRGDRLRRDAEALLAGDVAGERCLVARRDDLDEADRLEAAVAADDIPEVAEDLEAFEREPGFRFICIVHAHQRPRLSSSAGAQVAPLEQQDAPNSASRQVKSGTRPVGSAADHDHIRSSNVRHAFFLRYG